jgi:hypothetical protein
MEAQIEESFAASRAKSDAMIRDVFEAEDRRKRRVDALWSRKSILQAAHNEIQGKTPQADQLADAFKLVSHFAIRTYMDETQNTDYSRKS